MKRKERRLVSLCCCVAVLLSAVLVNSVAAEQLSSELCSDIAGQVIDGVSVVKAEWIELESEDTQRVCVVSGHRAPFLDIEVVLPEMWSGRYLQQGGGGFDGFIQSAVLKNEDGDIVGLHQVVAEFGAVYAASNGGNRQGIEGEAAPGVWLSEEPDSVVSLRDYAYQALETTLGFAHGLTQTAYGTLPDYGYFNGCSNGGRNAYISAQRWPQYFDGVVAGCEPMNIAGATTAWMSYGRLNGTPAALSAEQYSYAFNAALEACDADDGVKDGVMANPAACDFQPQELACTKQKAGHCLSAEQVSTLEMMLSDFVDADGRVLTSKYSWADFGRLAPGFGSLGSVYAMIGSGDRTWLKPKQQAKFDVNQHHYLIANGLLRSGVGHDRIGVAQFVASGNKLLSWHGGNDDLLSPQDHARMFAEVKETAAVLAEGSDIDVNQHARFFIVPGANHGGGMHPSVGWIAAIIDWVEHDKAPESLTYAREDGSTIPVCQYPQVPLADGDSGYACRMP